MLLKRLVIFAAIAALPAFGQSSGADTSTHKITPRQFHPIREKLEHDDGTATSTNWSGYAVTGSDFSSAYGSWKVPTVKCSSGDQYAAFWVGIDGYSSDTVEQTGTAAECEGSTAVYYNWYEFYPSASVEISSVPASPGNEISASVVWTSGSSFTITLKNVTTGKSYTKTGSVSGAARSSAEWIAEAPCCTGSGGILPLADFGTSYFGDDYTGVSGTNDATDSSHSGAIGSFSTVEEITMETSGGTVKAQPSALTSDGTSFDVVWHHK